MPRKCLLLPGARLVPPELETEFGAIASGMVPLESRPALHYIAEPYVQQGYAAAVATHEGADQVEHYLDRHPDLGISSVRVGVTRSLGETVLRALEALSPAPDELVINFADTFVGDRLAGPDVIACRKQTDLFRWTAFECEAAGAISGIGDKNCDKPGAEPRLVFVGVFGIVDVPAFQACLQRWVGQPDARPEALPDAQPEAQPDTQPDARPDAQAEADLDPFYSALRDYFNALPAERRVFQEVEDWRDFGHLDTYYATKRAFFVSKRFFNDVQVDSSRGILRKTSKGVRKFVNEVKWYLRLPRSLQHIAPRVMDYNLAFEDPFVELEFYGYPALADLYLYGDHDLGVWQHALGAIGNVLDEMQAHQHQAQHRPTDRGGLVAAMAEMYERKTQERLAPILDDPRFEPFLQDTVVINGAECLGLHAVLAELPEVAQRVGLYDQPYFTIIHGDLCLSNILFDRRNGFVRLVDPRGEFGKFDIHGDPRYDLAKLAHSFEGDYDFLVAGLFDLVVADGAIRLDVHHRPRHVAIRSLFARWLKERTHGSYAMIAQIKLIESLLFLSMVPLHADRFGSQQAFLARGLELFSRVALALPAIEERLA